MKGLRLPKRVRSYPGWVIKVKQTTAKELIEKFADSPGEKVQGAWDVDAMTIFIQASLAAKAKFKVYAHELQHAHNDWVYWVDQG